MIIEGYSEPPPKIEPLHDYLLTFRLHCHVDFGQEVYVVGSLQELGLWKDNTKVKLQWTDDHYWVNQQPVRIPHETLCHFQYKYVILNKNKEVVKWEDSKFNRLADLDILKVQKIEQSEPSKISTSGAVLRPGKHVEISEVWNKFSVCFSIFCPTESVDEVVRIKGNRQQFYRETPRNVSSSAEPEPLEL